MQDVSRYDTLSQSAVNLFIRKLGDEADKWGQFWRDCCKSQVAGRTRPPQRALTCLRKLLIYGLFMFFGQRWPMNITAAVKALNERAAREKWYHVCDPSLRFSEPCYDQLLAIWRAKAGSRNMPKRSEMGFRDLKDLLRNILVFERVSQNPSRYKFRLVGTGFQTMVPQEATGKMLEDVVPPAHLPRWVDCGDLILDGGQPMRFVGRVHLEGKEYLNAENLFIPLTNDEGEPTFIMGLCRYTPRRSEAEQSWEEMIASIPAAYV